METPSEENNNEEVKIVDDQYDFQTPQKLTFTDDNNSEIEVEEREDEPDTQPNPDGFFAETSDAGACSVRVALRVRPLIAHEIEGGKICVETFPPENMVIIGKDRNFTFDKVFGIDSPQQPIFET